MWTILPFSKRKTLIKKRLTKRFMTNHFNFSIAFWIFLPLSHLADEKSHPLRLSEPSRDESYFSAHSAKKSPLLNPWPSGFLPLPFRRRKRGTGLVNPAPRFRPLHFSGKTVCTFAAFTVGFCGASRPATPDLKQGTECSPYSAGKRVNMEYLPLPQPLLRGGQGFLYSLPPKRILAVHRAHFQPFSLPASP